MIQKQPDGYTEVRAVNSIAMSRRGYPAEHVEAVKDAYRRLYRDNGAPMAEKFEDLCKDYADVPAVLRLCTALTATAAGCHGRALEVARHDDKRVVDPQPVSTVD